jgi:hypothetical protein
MSGKRWALVYTGILRPLLGAPRTALRDNPMWILRGAIPCYEHDSSKPACNMLGKRDSFAAECKRVALFRTISRNPFVDLNLVSHDPIHAFQSCLLRIRYSPALTPHGGG